MRAAREVALDVRADEVFPHVRLSTPVIARVWVNADAGDSRQPWISSRPS